MEPPPETEGDGAPAATPDAVLRRSSRRRKPTGADQEQEAPAKKPKSASSNGGTRRNPKRKASEAVKHSVGVPDQLLNEALKPLTPSDIEEWEGWIELESEPAFFSTIIRDLGVRGVKAQELCDIDQVSLDILPKPVFGLIFLFEVIPGLDEFDGEDNAGELWFANQTTNNACATVALLNIIMNAQDVELGDKLRDFKEQTNGLCNALRGLYLSSNTFIRTIHNSFTRRLDHLNADLYLENEASAARSKKRVVSKKGARKGKTKGPEADYGFHFVGYVPADGHVWELDGLRPNPRNIGPIESGDWTAVARPHIQARMFQYAETQLAFNLLALCRDPLVSYSNDIARTLASLRHLHSRMQSKSDFVNLMSAEPPALDINDPSQLSEFQLNESDIEQAEIPQPLRDKTENAEFGNEEALEEHQDLTRDAKASMGEYRAEVMSMAADELRVQGRKKDYAPALHKWVAKLAEKGVLEDAIKNSS